MSLIKEINAIYEAGRMAPGFTLEHMGHLLGFYALDISCDGWNDDRRLARAFLRFAYEPDLPHTAELDAALGALAQVLAKAQLRTMPTINHTVESDYILLSDLAQGPSVLAATFQAIDAIKIIEHTSIIEPGFRNSHQPMVLITRYGFAALDLLHDLDDKSEGSPIIYRVGLTPFSDEPLTDSHSSWLGLNSFGSPQAGLQFLTHSFETREEAVAALKEMIADAASTIPQPA